MYFYLCIPIYTGSYLEKTVFMIKVWFFNVQGRETPYSNYRRNMRDVDVEHRTVENKRNVY